MRFLAVLKDSLREAIDTKVFYVTVGLSVVLTVLVASISFQPVPRREALDDITKQFRVVFPDRGTSIMARPFATTYAIKDLQQINDAPEPQAGNYRFVLTVGEEDFREAVTFWDQSESGRFARPNAAGAEKSKPGLPEKLCEDFITSQFATFGNVEVTRVRPIASKDKTNLAFEVETQGTRGVRGWPHDPSLLFGAVRMRFLRQSLGLMVYWIEDRLVNGFGAWIGILASVVITAFFIPNMLRKGTLDLLLVKPMHRVTLLLYKYLGGLTFMFLNAAIAVGGMWLALGFRSGIWATGFLLTVFVMTFFFAILYAVSTFFGVVTRSAIVSILMTCIAWFILWLVGTGYTSLDLIRKDKMLSKEVPIPEWIYNSVDQIHFVLPRTSDLDALTTRLLSQEIMTKEEVRRQRLDKLPDVTWGESLTVSGIFIGVLLGLTCWRFAAKDF